MLEVNQPAKINKEGSTVRSPCQQTLHQEFLWIQSHNGIKVFKNVLACLRECCMKLHLGHKCDDRLMLPITEPKAEQHHLTGKHGGDNLKVSVTLLGDNVLLAEVAIKHSKTPGGTFRAVAQPDVQWKLQQLQDLANHLLKATTILCDVQDKLKEISNNKAFNNETGTLILEAANFVKEEISACRTSILLPRKRSLLELCYFAPTKKFIPPLPQDQLISYYISSCRLVCASYQMVPKQAGSQGLTISMAECSLTYLDDILKLLNVSMGYIQKLVSDLSMSPEDLVIST